MSDHQTLDLGPAIHIFYYHALFLSGVHRCVVLEAPSQQKYRFEIMSTRA
jgi:hypothetical protein